MAVFQAGQRITAATLNAFCVPAAVIKPADQSVTSSTVLVNDNALVLPVVASATYLFECVIMFEAASGGDLKCQWTVPAGATLAGEVLFRNLTPADTVHGALQASGLVQSAGSGAGTDLALAVNGSLVMSSTAGSVQFQFAQNTSNGTATIVHAGSTICLRRIT
jgi:hypothetical protein